MFAVSTCGPIGCPASPPPLSSQNIQSNEKSFTGPRARGEAPTMSFVLGTNPEGKERVKGKASRIPSSRIGSALGCVRRNAQHLELKLLESTWFVLNTVLMFAVSTCGPIGCPASPPPLSSQNIQSNEKSFTGPRARGEAPTMSFVLGTNPEGKERVKGKASRISSSRIGSALGCVRRNAQHLELKLLESTWFVLNTVLMFAASMYVCTVTHAARVLMNRTFAPEKLVSQDGLISYTQAESGAYLRDFSRVPRRRPFIYLGQSRVYRVTQLHTH